MLQFTRVACLATTLLASASLADATTFRADLALDPAGPSVNRASFTLSSLGISRSGTSDASGGISADVTFDLAGAPTAIAFLDGTRLAFTDVTLLVLPGVPFATATNVRGTITSPTLNVAAGGSVDLGGAVLTLNEGFITVLGDDPSNNDLATNPVILTLEPGNVASLLATDLGGGLVDLSLTGPVSFSGLVDETPEVLLTIAGNLSSRGTVVIPEPGMLGIAAVGLLALRRRR